VKVTVMRGAMFGPQDHTADVVIIEDTDHGALRIIEEDREGNLLGLRTYAAGHWLEAWIAEPPPPDVVEYVAARMQAAEERARDDFFKRPRPGRP
jgi:hypothetical protein